MLLLNFDHQQLVQLQSLINSYFAHFNHADCHKLKSAILNKYHFLLYFFDLSKGKADFRLNPKLRFADLYSQYQYFFRKFASYIILFQVGCYYETYGRQAKTMHEQFGLNYIKPRNRLGTRTGFPVKHLLKYLDKLCRQQFQAVVIEQSGIKVSKIETRKIKYLLIQSVRQGETCPGQEVLL